MAILVVAAWLRFTGLTFGFPDAYHPDEARAGYAVRDCSAGKTGGGRYRHPPLMVKTACLLDRALLRRLDLAPRIPVEKLALRTVSALSGTATVAFAYLLALRFASAPGALAAAALVAIFPALVAQSKYGTPDSLLAMLVAAALWLQLRLLERRGPGDYALAAGAAALAFVAKYNAGFLVFSFVAAHLFTARRAARSPLAPGPVVASAAAVAVVFLYAFWTAISGGNLANVAGGVAAESSHLASEGHFGFELGASDGYFVFHFVHSVLPASGPLLLACMVAGIALLAARALGPSGAPALVVLAFALPYYAVVEAIYKVPPSFERYALPLVVVYAVAAAALLDRTTRPLGRRGVLALVLALAAVGYHGASRSVAMAARGGADTRDAMRVWIREHTPKGERFFMQWPGIEFYYPRPPGGRRFEKIKTNFLDAHRFGADGELVLASSLLYRRYLDFPEQAPLWAVFYRRLFTEGELLHEEDAGLASYMFHDPTLRLYRVGAPPGAKASKKGQRSPSSYEPKETERKRKPSPSSSARISDEEGKE